MQTMCTVTAATIVASYPRHREPGYEVTTVAEVLSKLCTPKMMKLALESLL